jgi:hypothetical protein
MNGKGDNRRPASVSSSEMQARWAATFGSVKRVEPDESGDYVAVVDSRPSEDQ